MKRKIAYYEMSGEVLKQIKSVIYHPTSNQRCNSRGNDRKKTTMCSPARIDMCVIWVILMILPVPSSAQCSNCVESKCKTSGECLEGCVPGFADIRCQRKCPPNCINNTCHLDRQRGTYVCSDGCQDGYCGSGCKLTCQNGCTTCDRASCSVCDVKPCVGDNYGKKCTPCPENFEKCDKDTGKCIKCKKGFYGESCESICPTCLSRNQEIQQGCQTGCDVCPEGLHVNESYTACSSNCLTNHCDRSGRCTHGCKAGFYGRKCDVICNNACTRMLCQQSSGHCVYGCIDGYVQTDNGCQMFEGVRGHGIWLIVTAAVLSICILTMMAFFFMKMRKQDKYRGLLTKNNREQGKVTKYEGQPHTGSCIAGIDRYEGQPHRGSCIAGIDRYEGQPHRGSCIAGIDRYEGQPHRGSCIAGIDRYEGQPHRGSCIAGIDRYEGHTNRRGLTSENNRAMGERAVPFV